MSFTLGDIHQETLDFLISPKGSILFIFSLFNSKYLFSRKVHYLKIYLKLLKLEMSFTAYRIAYSNYYECIYKNKVACNQFIN